MYTEYNSKNVKGSLNDRDNQFFVVLKIVLIIGIIISLFLLLLKFNVLSLNSSVLPDAVILNQNEIGLKTGDTYQLVSNVLPDSVNNKQVIFTSSDPDVASVDENTGLVKGIKEGTAVINIRTVINNKQSQCVVNVSNDNVLLTGISLYNKNINLAVNYTYDLSYKVFPLNATEINLKFISSDPSVVNVDSNGKIMALKPGNAIVSVASSDGLIKDNAYVTVYKKDFETVVFGEIIKNNEYPESITLSHKSIYLNKNTSFQLFTNNINNNEITWISSNPDVLTVDMNGLVKTHSNGIAEVVAKTINGLTDSCQISVVNYNVPLKSVLFTNENSTLTIGDTMQLITSFEPSDATNKTVVFTSSDSNVVSVNSSGIIKALSLGTAIITVTSLDGSFNDTVRIDVIDKENIVKETNISFLNSNYSVDVNQTISLIPIITPSNTTYKSLTFESSNNSIATVDENGVVKGIKSGEVIITVSSKNNKKASVKVKVNSVSVSAVKLNNTNININKGETYSLIADVLPINATNRKVNFKSLDTSIVTVDHNGIIRAVNQGTTTISVETQDGSKCAICVVTVK